MWPNRQLVGRRHPYKIASIFKLVLSGDIPLPLTKLSRNLAQKSLDRVKWTYSLSCRRLNTYLLEARKQDNRRRTSAPFVT